MLRALRFVVVVTFLFLTTLFAMALVHAGAKATAREVVSSCFLVALFGAVALTAALVPVASAAKPAPPAPKSTGGA